MPSRVDFSCASSAIVGAGLPWTGVVPDIHPETFDILDHGSNSHHGPRAAQNRADPCDYVCACETFLIFFRRLSELEDIALGSSEGTSSATASRTKRFAAGTSLHFMLTMLPDYDHGIRDVRFIDEYTCMACLLFLNVTLHGCYMKGTNFDRYLDWLDTEINQLIAHANPSITSVLWLFLKNGGYPDGERCWLVSRLLRVAKRLEWKRHGTV